MMMNGINSILQSFFQGENRITAESVWKQKVEEARINLQNENKIHYMLGYPQGSEPTFYVLCETEDLMQHAKDWLNCALPRFCCQFARPCKKPEFQFESELIDKWPHGVLKVKVWSQQHTGFDSVKYKDYLPYAVKECQVALDEMIHRFNSSPNIKRESNKSIGMLIKAYIEAHKANDLEVMVQLYDEIISKDDLERRNKDILKFMRLEKEKKWQSIIDFAHERNVSTQVISSAVVVAIMNALVFKSCNNWESLSDFEIDWPLLYERSQEFYPVLIKSHEFDDEKDWRLWAIIAHAINIHSFNEIVSNRVDTSWLEELNKQDTCVNAQEVTIENKLDISNLVYSEESICEVLNYAQTCCESEVIELYEWVENSPLKMKMILKSNISIQSLWHNLETNASNLYQLST